MLPSYKMRSIASGKLSYWLSYLPPPPPAKRTWECLVVCTVSCWALPLVVFPCAFAFARLLVYSIVLYFNLSDCFCVGSLDLGLPL